MGKIAGTSVVVLFICLAVIIPLWIHFSWKMPADVEYGNLFGADVNMATQGSTTLIGQDSIHDYVMRIWLQMNETFKGRDYAHTYNTPWWWGEVKDNSLAKQNEYFNSLNASIYKRQAWVDSVIEKGGYVGGDPVQTVINQTRVEMNLYGGLDWALGGSWYLTFQPTAYWADMYAVLMFVVFSLIAIFGGAASASI